MRVFVAGGTGAVGRHTVPTLVQQGHTVTAVARTPEKAAALAAQGATAVSVSLFDRSALAAAFAGHDAVVNLASAIPPMRRWMSARAWRVNDRVRIQGSAAVVDAALAAGVGRVIQESVSMLYRDQGDRWVDENAPIDRYPMARGNLTEIPSAPELYIPLAKHGRQGKPRKDGKPSASPKRRPARCHAAQAG